MEELEGKLVGVGVEALLKRLKELGVGIEVLSQSDKIFQLGEGILRVRKEGDKFILTHKGKLRKKGPLKSREETEFLVSDPGRVMELLSALGVDISHPRTNEKRLFRFYVAGAKGELVFIKGLPPTLELEGSEDNIRKACELLGLRFEDLKPISWFDIQPM